MRGTFAGLLAAAAVLIGGAAPAPPPPRPQALAPGVWLIPGGVTPDREPDGNTVVFEGRAGLAVLDTGRHAWHTRAILDFAKARGRPVVAVVNSHWHLDHVSGNAAVKAAYPQATVHASGAIDEALTGFLKRGIEGDREYLAKGNPPESLAEDLRQDMVVSAAGDRLKPDVVVRASGDRVLAGRRLEVRLANGATKGDVWLFDPKSRVAAVGDLVTLPAAFLDTACPKGWAAALGEIETTPFKLLVPGHGRPLTRAEFGTWRVAFGALVDCAASARTKAECAGDWTRAVEPLLTPGEARERRLAGAFTEGYVDLLRSGSLSANCA